MNRECGLSIVELVGALAILVVGMLSLAMGLHGGARLARETADNYMLTLGYRNAVTELEKEDFSELTSNCGPGSGRDTFWIGDDNLDPKQEEGLFYSAPRKVLAEGQIEFFSEEASLPSSWSSFIGGLDLNVDGLVEPSEVEDYRILPTRLSFTLDGPTGPRIMVTDFILLDRKQ